MSLVPCSALDDEDGVLHSVFVLFHHPIVSFDSTCLA